MSVVTINSKNQRRADESFTFLSDGFRPFFFGALLFSVISVSYWILVYAGVTSPTLSGISPFYWHAHEMIYGYTMAVIAGFLLTAVTNWTGGRTAQGHQLVLLFLAWIVARCLWFFGTAYTSLAFFADLLFNVGLLVSLSAPILRVKQWRQIGIISKVLLLTVGNVFFYLGADYSNNSFLKTSTHGGVLLVIALIATITTRVLPGFIRNSVDNELKNQIPVWVSRANLSLSLAFFISYLFLQSDWINSIIAGLLFLLSAFSLWILYTPGIWRSPLLWGLYFSILSIALGYLLFALQPFFPTIFQIPLHAFAYGGIGFATLSMMPRVILGHTGRSVQQPPIQVTVACCLLVIGFLSRVILPLIGMTNYSAFILISQLAWILSFTIILFGFWSLLINPRRKI